jgi:hypothetical protein
MRHEFWLGKRLYVKRQYYERKKRNSVTDSRIMETERKKENKERCSLYLCEEGVRHKLLSCSESNNGKGIFK